MIAARPDEVAQEIGDLIGTPLDDVIRISAKAVSYTHLTLPTSDLV